MLSRRIAASGRSLSRSLAKPTSRAANAQIRSITHTTEPEDPSMNGGYVNPPPEKRMFRDPYADWWDKQERRNFGEPCHEDNDILGMFSPEEYTYTTPGKGIIMLGAFVATVGALATGVYMTYPDKPSAPREFPGGLDAELGGNRAVRTRKEGEGQWPVGRT